MNSPAMDIKTLLDDESSLGLTYGTDLFVSSMPDSSDLCVCVQDVGGYDSGMTLGRDHVYRPTVQVRVRCPRGGYETGYALASSIRALLDGSHGEEVEGSRYVLIRMEGDVNHVGSDDRDRALLTMNFTIHRTEV